MKTTASCTHDLPSMRSTAVATLSLRILLRMLVKPTPSETRMMAPAGWTLRLTLHLWTHDSNGNKNKQTTAAAQLIS